MWAGAAAFNVEYGIWVEEQHQQMCEFRAALRAHVPDNELRLLVEVGMAHYDDLFRLKAVAAKTDVFQLVSGTWVTPAERCFMWMGGLRPSEGLKVHHGTNKFKWLLNAADYKHNLVLIFFSSSRFCLLLHVVA
jgi:hypothetical protein